jgi:XTP/dITP diphosphohydrolase
MAILILATRNEHKVAEIRAILGNGYNYRSLADFPDAPEVVEDANTFAGNATRKAVALARWLSAKEGAPVGQSHNRLVLADDSGLEVDALNGEPGVHSARFAALDMGRPGNSTDAENRLKLLHLLRDIPLEKRTARFHCVLALTPIVDLPWPNASPVCYGDELEMATQLYEGCCEGRIIFEPHGTGGFGYDPLFVPEGYSETFGELPQGAKNKLSHRARALSKLSKHLTYKEC